jgi:hypothetical protein
MSSKDKKAEVMKTFKDCGVVLCADTPKQVEMCIEAIKNCRQKNPGAKYILVVDEADAMLRTSERIQKFEQVFEQLLLTNPTVVSGPVLNDLFSSRLISQHKHWLFVLSDCYAFRHHASSTL